MNPPGASTDTGTSYCCSKLDSSENSLHFIGETLRKIRGITKTSTSPMTALKNMQKLVEKRREDLLNSRLPQLSYSKFAIIF